MGIPAEGAEGANVMMELAAQISRHETDSAASAQGARALAALLSEAEPRRAAAAPSVLYGNRLTQAMLDAAGGEDRVPSRS